MTQVHTGIILFSFKHLKIRQYLQKYIANLHCKIHILSRPCRNIGISKVHIRQLRDIAENLYLEIAESR